jgi:phage tail-like protein
MATVDTDRDRLARYANLADGWLGLKTVGVEIGPSGELRLQTVPDSGVPAGEVLDPPTGEGPAGCALDSSGTGFVSEPDEDRVRMVTRCAPNIAPQGEVIGPRRDDGELLPGIFTAPRGLLLGPRRRLYVADVGAVLVVDPGTGTITGRWTDVTAGWCLAGDRDWIYLLDRPGAGNRGRVRRFSADGAEDIAYSTAVSSIAGNPVRMTTAGQLLLVVMRRSAGDFVVPVRANGTVDSTTARAWAAPARIERDPLTGRPVTTPVALITGIAATGGRVYLVDGIHADLLTFTSDGGYIGTTRPVHAISDVWASERHVLWTYPHEPNPMLRHVTDAAWRRTGTFVCGPINTGTATARRELRVRFDRVPGGHLQLWTAVTQGGVAPAPSTVPLTADVSTAPWTASPADVDSALVSDPTGPGLFIGGALVGDGANTPVVHQIGVSGPPSWLDLLPAVYRKNPRDSEFLDRLLRLLASVQSETAQERVDLARRFDPWTADDSATDRSRGTVLEELAGWLAVVLDERSAESVRRNVVATAFAAQAVRGTHRGLLAAIQQHFPRLKIEITEPAQRAEIWSLPSAAPRKDGECAVGGLGFDTMLCAAPAHGAVVGINSVVDQSTLTAGNRIGSPLFGDLAHRFHVAVLPCAGRDTRSLDADLRALIDAEKPAHTVYTLCIASPQARVGVQARIGVDAILAGPAADLDVGAATELGAVALTDTSAARDEPGPALVGETRLGQGRLT